MQIAEVMDPYHSLIDVTRCDLWTLVTVHPGAPTVEGIQEIAHKLHAYEAAGWGTPWAPPDADIDFSALLADPVSILAAIEPGIVTIPALPPSVPQAMRVPGVDYSPTR